VGLPYTEHALNTTASGGSPYGATHLAGVGADRPVDAVERGLAVALGRRLAETARKLAA
jgi:NAD(P)H dehydrogenase (quinone)